MAREGRRRFPEFGRLLKEARLASGTESQSDVAKMLKKSQSFLAQCENGLIIDPSAELLKAFAAAYKIRYEDLVAALVLEKYGVDLTHAADLSLVLLEKEVDRIKLRLEEVKKRKG